MSTPIPPDSEWPAETTPLPPVPPVVPPPGPPPLEPEPGNRIGQGMLLAIGVLAVIAAVLAAVFLTRNDKKGATATTVVVTTTPAPTTPATTAATKPKKLILPVPDLVGQQWKDASAGLRRAGFHVTFVTVPSALPRGSVTAQDPAAATRVARGSDIRLNVSSGVGQPTTTSQSATTTSATPTATTSTGAATTPTTQTTTAATTTEAQPASAAVPALTGEVQQAVQQLDQAGFAASIAYVPSTQPLGTVIAQAPAAGSTAKTGSQVTVNASSGPNDTQEGTVPNVVGQRIAQALPALHGAGLRLILLRARVSDRSKAGLIVSQTPLPGKRAPKNAQVLVYLGAYRQ